MCTNPTLCLQLVSISTSTHCQANKTSKTDQRPVSHSCSRAFTSSGPEGRLNAPLQSWVNNSTRAQMANIIVIMCCVSMRTQCKENHIHHTQRRGMLRH